jgi:O-antigen ligase
MTASAPFPAAGKLFDRERWARAADGLAVAVAVSLPWSTSATSVLVALWIVAMVPTLRPADVARELKDPASGLPVLLWAFAIVGVLWSDASFAEQIYAFKGFHKLLVIPLLLIHFRRSERGHWVIGGFLLSCAILLAASWFLHVRGGPPGRFAPGVPVKDYIVQSAEFLICAFALGHLAVDAWHKEQRLAAGAMALLTLLFLANVAFVAAGRTSLAAFPVLLVLFAVQRFALRGVLALSFAGALFAAVIWVSSSYVRERAFGVAEEIQRSQSTHAETSAGFRVESWKKSVAFVADAPIFGHGTGSIPSLFRGAAAGGEIAGLVTGNPHNQTLEIAVQFGLVGVVLLYAMWIAHLLMFGTAGLAAWLGQGLVTQTIVGALFLSYLLDFSSGWLYVFGVGVLGGMVGRQRADKAKMSS